VAHNEDETLDRLTQADSLCDRYEEILQAGSRLTAMEFLRLDGVEQLDTPSEMIVELEKLEKAYHSPKIDSSRADTQAFVPEASKRVGRYELRRPLGSGGFGEVWVAFDPHLDREIAIKIPHPGVLGDSAAIDRFYREAKSAAKLKHPNIVRIHDAGSDGSTHFIAAELIAGKTLRDFCSAHGLEIRLAVGIVADLAGAVHYAHRNQIIHRDIKPGNVLMDASDHPHLTDFGLASQLDASALTTKGTVLGTPIYMAPEQAAGRFGAALPACDQYSLGTVLYELLTGRPPFSGTNSVVLYHKLNSAPPPPRVIRPDIPPEVEAICLRAMERIPEKRYPDCEAMAAELRAWLAGTLDLKPLTLSHNRTKWLVGVFAILFALVSIWAWCWPPRWTQKNDASKSSSQGPSFDARPSNSTNLLQSATPLNVEILDSTHYLPLHPDRPKKVVDFKEIHGATASDTATWLRNLGPDYLPSFIGEHVNAEPPQFHAIAYRLNIPTPFRVDYAITAGGDLENCLRYDKINHHTLAFAGKLTSIGPDGHFLRTSTSDTDYVWSCHSKPNDFDKMVDELKKGKFVRPILIVPRYYVNSGDTLIFSIGAHGRTNWDVVRFLSLDELKQYIEKTRAEERFLFQLCGEAGAVGEARFSAIAHENTDNYDWDFQCDMSVAEYETELIRRKSEGFRPTTVTSYGDSNDPKYAAAWIRYFNIPKK
jgi:serine/threonine protein kinase